MTRSEEILAMQDLLAQKYKYKPLPEKLSVRTRNFYKENIPAFLNIEGSKDCLYINDTKLCEGYNRIVIGDYGAFIEMYRKQIELKNIKTAKGQQYRSTPKYIDHIKYFWLTLKTEEHVKIYLQLRPVKYADYKADRYYISPLTNGLRVEKIDKKETA